MIFMRDCGVMYLTPVTKVGFDVILPVPTHPVTIPIISIIWTGSCSSIAGANSDFTSSVDPKVSPSESVSVFKSSGVCQGQWWLIVFIVCRATAWSLPTSKVFSHWHLGDRGHLRGIKYLWGWWTICRWSISNLCRYEVNCNYPEDCW